MFRFFIFTVFVILPSRQYVTAQINCELKNQMKKYALKFVKSNTYMCSGFFLFLFAMCYRDRKKLNQLFYLPVNRENMIRKCEHLEKYMNFQNEFTKPTHQNY